MVLYAGTYCFRWFVPGLSLVGSFSSFFRLASPVPTIEQKAEKVKENQPPLVALVICLTLVCTVFCAKVVGCLLPLLAEKIGLDQG